MGPFETERLLLRPLRLADLDDIFALIYTDPDVYRLYSSLGSNKDAVRARLIHYENAPGDDFGRLGVVLKETGALIGQVHLDPYVDTYERLPGAHPLFQSIEVELAFAFGKEYWGQSLACEACQRCIEYAFLELKLPRLVNGIHSENERSIRFHRRLGYTIHTNTKTTSSVNIYAVLDNHLLES
ncbi:MAG: GNAT family N-acetyltransferase [Caldilineaceae bacterium]